MAYLTPFIQNTEHSRQGNPFEGSLDSRTFPNTAFPGMKRLGIPAERERASSRVESASTTDQHQSVAGPAETEQWTSYVCCALRERALAQLVSVGGDWGE